MPEILPPKRYFGLHMVKGVAQYQHPVTGAPDIIMVDDPVLNDMDATMEGVPFFVHHQKSPDQAPDGIVVKSFFNSFDGNHWAEFIAMTDRCQEAIKKGWALSNAYTIDKFGPAGKWHAVPYKTEVLGAHYTHLAIVDTPRYAESVILTPEEFKAYNERKKSEVKSVENSSKERKKKGMFKFFKREEIQNSADLEATMIELDGAGQMSLSEVIKGYEKLRREKSNASPIMDEMINVGDEKMSVKDMVENFSKMKKKNSEWEEKAKKDKENAEEEEKEKAKKEKENAEKDEADKKEKDKQNSLEKEAAEKSEKEVFNSMMNAQRTSVKEPAKVVDLGMDQLARGRALFGSGK